ncbi:hypothetical protein B9T24_10020 [Acinetobacter sp. ANC 4654]|uniref:hypothetical protein n=1 Tax=Acinetobacter sp. ANC 4654 TaxID=1977872 RepID=UPI000A347404|nr:hypothetical protein [Acinetobacter sp. ANC 4654]OTG95079.1 hypothetical protein B9T24_10020 [Acinetobacter sp. ANC 4654]
MNLIEKLGLEKCQAIVDAVPDGGTHFKLSFGLSIFYLLSSGDGADLAGLWIDDGDDSYWGLSSYKNFELFMPENRFISIEDLRTAIAEHSKCHHDWNETTSNGDAYRFFVCKHCDSTRNYVPFEADHCTDIRNHISPLTGVIER